MEDDAEVLIEHIWLHGAKCETHVSEGVCGDRRWGRSPPQWSFPGAGEECTLACWILERWPGGCGVGVGVGHHASPVPEEFE